MRLRIVAGCGLSLLLVDVVPIPAQQRSSLTCEQRERLVKSTQREVERLLAQAQEKKPACTAAAPGPRRAEACGTYGEALVLHMEKQSELKTLTDDAAWRACQAVPSATSTGYKGTAPRGAGAAGDYGAQAATSATSPSGAGSQGGWSGSGQSAGSSGTGSGSGQGGGFSGSGSGSGSGAGTQQTANNQISPSGSGQLSPGSTSKSGMRGGGRRGVVSLTKKGGVNAGRRPTTGSRGPSHGSRFGSSHMHRPDFSRSHSSRSHGSRMGGSRSFHHAGGHGGHGGRGGGRRR